MLFGHLKRMTEQHFFVPASNEPIGHAVVYLLKMSNICAIIKKNRCSERRKGYERQSDDGNDTL